MATGDPYGQGVTEDDLAIYQFDSLGQDSDLAHLLDDTDNDLNDETFGGFADDTGANRDFDFAGSTSRFLGNEAPSAANASGGGAANRGAKQLVPLSSDWGADPLLSSKPIAAGTAQSPWTSLNDDPLLSRAAAPPLPPPASASSTLLHSAASPSPAPTAGQPAPTRQVKTLEEVEAEIRSHAAAARQQPPAASTTTEPDQSANRPMTLEEVEADMLRRRQLEQQQLFGIPMQLPPGMSPQPQAALPPGMQPSTHAAAVFPGHLPPHILQTLPPQFPTLPPNIQHQIVAQRMAAFGHQLPPPVPGSAPASPMVQPAGNAYLGASAGNVGMPFVPGNLAGPPPGMAPSAPATPHVNAAPSHLIGAPVPAGAPLPSGATAESNLLSTLFPPLPSQTGTVASVERQLELLSHVGHAQHPSLMGAQLQALLQHAHAAAAGAGQGTEKEPSEADEAASLKRQKAEELVRAVEQRILEHEEAEQKRKRKAMKIASMVRFFSCIVAHLSKLLLTTFLTAIAMGRRNTTISCPTPTRTSSRESRCPSCSRTTLMPTTSTSTSWRPSKRLVRRQSSQRPEEDRVRKSDSRISPAPAVPEAIVARTAATMR